MLLRGLERFGRAVVVHFDQQKCILGDPCSRLAYAKQGVASSNINIYDRKSTFFSPSSYSQPRRHRWLRLWLWQGGGCGPRGIDVEKQGFRAAWPKVPVTWAEIEGAHTNFSRSSFSLLSSNYEWLVGEI